MFGLRSGLGILIDEVARGGEMKLLQAFAPVSFLVATLLASPAVSEEVLGHRYVVSGTSSSNSDIAQKSPQSVHESDLKGWNGTTWGMSAKALQEKFGDAIQPVAPSEIYCLKQSGRNCEGVTQWVLRDCEIGRFKYDVNFELSNEQLEWVFLRKENSPEAIGSFVNLSEMLKDKYGLPTDTNTTAGITFMEWKLPSTEINIFRILKTADDSSFGLNYKPRKAPEPRI